MLIKKAVKNQCLYFSVLVWILVFQNALEIIWGPFSYIDETVALFGACLGLYDIVIVRKWRPSKDQLWVGIPLLLFIAIGLAGNVVYQYQPLKCVIIDLYTNLKFFFAIGTGYYLFAGMQWEDMRKTARLNAKIIILFLFALFLVDRVFCFWSTGERYGIHSAVLFYKHPTYLAGAMNFLLVLLTVFYQKKNIPYIVMAVIILAFTLRAKAIACAALYLAMFVFFIVLKLHLKIWHIVVAASGCIAVGWKQIYFYFFTLADQQARAVMLQKSFQVMKDHFPLGSGFGTYGSAEAAKHYSIVYHNYGFNDVFFLRDVRDVENTLRLISKSKFLSEQYALDPDGYLYGATFMHDQFWPIIFGQTGFFGTLIFLFVLAVLLKKCMAAAKHDLYAHAGVLFAFATIFIASAAETAFHHSVSVSLAVVVGLVFYQMEKEKTIEK